MQVSRGDIRDKATRLTSQGLFSLILSDINSYKGTCMAMLCKGFGAVFFCRVSNLLHRKRLCFFSKVIQCFSGLLTRANFSAPDPNNCPVIDEGPVIAFGAGLVGRITIGSNVTIGPNAIVLKDIPSDRTVAPPSSRVIPKLRK